MENIRILAGNDLRSGRVVYLREDGEWSTDHSQAHGLLTQIDCDHAEDIGRSSVAQNQVVDPYLVRIAVGTAAQPSHIRERIRSTGPTCRTASGGVGASL